MGVYSRRKMGKKEVDRIARKIKKMKWQEGRIAEKSAVMS